MAKKLKYNSDFMSLKMDKELEQIEDKLSALYANTAYDVNQKFAEFTKTFEKDDKAMALKVETGEITNEEYSLWRQRHILQTDLYKATVDSLTDIMVSSDISAMALVDEALPSVIAQSYNFTQSLGWASAEASGLNVGNFQIYNADSVQAILRENKKILPVVDVPKDEAWNHDKINKEIASSIIKGDPIQKVAENLQKVAKMDENSAIRNARTAMTSAENLGRTESAERLKQNGIPVEEVWQATYDNRVRDTHLLMDGTKRSENGTFGDDILETPLKYPADPDGDPEEIYNCRCRLGVVLQGIDHSKDAELYEQFMKEKYPESYQKMQENKGYQAKQEQIEQAKERKERLEAELAQKQPAESVESAFTPSDKQLAYEEAIRNESIEKGTYFDADGNVLLTSEGDSAEVSFDPIEFNHKVEQAVWDGVQVDFTHNHPFNEIFSPEDVRNLENLENHSASAVCANGTTYRLVRDQEQSGALVWDESIGDFRDEVEILKIADDYQEAYVALLDNEPKRIDFDSYKDYKKAQDEFYVNVVTPQMEEWLKENAEKKGYIFIKEVK